MDSRPQILFTSPLSDYQLQFAANNGLDIEVIQLVKIIPSIDQSIIDKILELSNKQILAIFTSQSAIRIVLEILDHKVPNWQIACTAPNTKEQASVFGVHNIIADGYSAIDLAEKLIALELKYDQIVFFSGSDRKEDLPNILKKNHLGKWQEIKVYHNELNKIKLDKYYDGIAFCSPSAVEAYFEKNYSKDNTKVFAIGQSTAKTLKEKGIEKPFISTIPDKNNLIEDIVKTFN